MEDKEFRRRLSEVAEWKIPETLTATTTGEAKKKRGRKSAEDEYMELRETMFRDEFGGVNLTYPPMLTKVKVVPSICGDCGVVCPEGQKKEIKFYISPVKHWKERCTTCDKVKNPETGKFDVESYLALSVYREHLMKKQSEKK